jgi:DNA modification methylase
MQKQVVEGYDGAGTKDYEAAGVQNPSSVKARIIANARARVTGRGINKEGGKYPKGVQPQRANSGGYPSGITRNKRDVWFITPQPFRGAHFATMPEKLIEPCIIAGCPAGGLVLDPFVGSGTVVSVANRLARRGVGVDLSYQDLAGKRTAQRGLLFTA